MSLTEHDEDPLVGRTIDKYELLRVIGRGGMGTVYEAMNAPLGKRVAVKVIDPELARSQESIERFQREAQAAAAVESAHIIDVVDAGKTDDGLPFLVMELLRGEDLAHRLRRLGRLELGEALDVAAQISRGLARAHEAGIVHRDLKPDNVFLVDRDDGSVFVKILDFGISKIERRAGVPTKTLTREGVVLGTPYYMAPEQAQGHVDVDARADIWSLGAILFECLTGRPPYTGATYEQVIVRLCSNEADDVRTLAPSVPEGVAQVLSTALQRDRELRPPGARAFLDALAEASGGLVSSRRREGTPTPIGRLAASNGDERPSPSPPPSFVSRAPARPAPDARGPAPPRRSHLAVAAVSIAAGAALALGYAQRGAGKDAPEALAAAPTSAAATSITLALQANAPGARFLVDGQALEPPALVGSRGAKRRVRVEADGFAPLEADLLLDGVSTARRFELVPLPSAAPPRSAEPAEPRVEASAKPAPSAPPAPRRDDAAPRPGLSIRRE